jgi:hypothetical protein
VIDFVVEGVLLGVLEGVVVIEGVGVLERVRVVVGVPVPELEAVLSQGVVGRE